MIQTLFYTPPSSKILEKQGAQHDQLRKKLNFSKQTSNLTTPKQSSLEDELELLSQVWSFASNSKTEEYSPERLSDDESLSFEQFQYRVVCPDQCTSNSSSNKKLNEISEIFHQVECNTTEDCSFNEQSLSFEDMSENQILSSLSLNRKEQFYIPQMSESAEQLGNYWIPPLNSNQHNFIIHPDEILKDRRTTLMLKNIPSNYSVYELVQEVDQSFKNKYDFIYMPYDQIRKCNVGYAFINLLTPQFVKEFYQKFYWRKWKMITHQDKEMCIALHSQICQSLRKQKYDQPTIGRAVNSNSTRS